MYNKKSFIFKYLSILLLALVVSGCSTLNKKSGMTQKENNMTAVYCGKTGKKSTRGQLYEALSTADITVVREIWN